MINNYYNPYAQPSCRIQRSENAMNTQCACENHGSDTDGNIEMPKPEVVLPAMAFVPVQHAVHFYDSMKALMFGTIFPELNKPFTGCCRYE